MLVYNTGVLQCPSSLLLSLCSEKLVAAIFIETELNLDKTCISKMSRGFFWNFQNFEF